MDTIIVKKTVTGILLNGLTTEEFVAYFIAGVFGIVVGMVLSPMKERDVIINTGGFSIAYWWSENRKRLLKGILAVLIGIHFSEALFGTKITVQLAIICGIATDNILNSLSKFIGSYTKNRTQ